MTATDTDNVFSQSENLRERLRDYVAYTLTSARGLYREPISYGPMRMVDALEKVLSLLRDLGLSDSELDLPVQIVRDNRWKAGTDPEGFAYALDNGIMQLVRITLEEKAKDTESVYGKRP